MISLTCPFITALSNGAQSAVANHYKGMIFLPIETSGEGDFKRPKAKRKSNLKMFSSQPGSASRTSAAMSTSIPNSRSPFTKCRPAKALPAPLPSSSYT
jgi:hypothetical protein